MMTSERVGVGHGSKCGATYVENWVKVLEEDPREIHWGAADEPSSPTFIGASSACRIYRKPIYRTLGVEDIRHRRRASTAVVMRRLLSLYYILE